MHQQERKENRRGRRKRTQRQNKPGYFMAPKAQTTDKDIGWQHGYCKDPKNKIAVTCNYCAREIRGGIYRLKQHLVGGFSCVTACQTVPEHVKEEIAQFMVKKKTQKIQINMLSNLDEVDMNEEEENEVEVADPRRKTHANEAAGVGGSKRPRQGPSGGSSIHSFFKAATASEKAKGGKQTTINTAYKKELRDKACSDLARWLYEAAIPFNVVKLDSFKVALDSVGRYGIGMKPPSYHEVRVPLLKKEVANTDDMLKGHREEWAKTGCTIMSDGWRDRNHRSIINFLVNCSKGSLFLESVDASSYSQTGEKKLELLSRIIEKVGPSNVVQVVTDNDSTYKLAGKLLEVKYPHIFWTPCAAHCIDLMLEDIGKIPSISKTIKRAIEVSGYIYQRAKLVNLMRKFTNQRNLIRPAKTRFATSVLTLQSFHLQKANLRKMFTSEEWTGSNWAKEQGGKKACQTILMPSFWNNVLYFLKVSNPLVEVLRLVDGEKKPAMGYIYEAMDRAKETIAVHFKGLEEKYEHIFQIIDERWECQLHRPLHAAAYFLNPEFYYPNADRIEEDEEVMTGFFACLEKLVPNIESQDQISYEMSKYKKADGLLGSTFAVRQRTKKAPADWWSAYGSTTPALQKFAIKILSLTCSSSGCERNWSVFEQGSWIAHS